MFQNAAIDVAIGLILMYLMLSLLCTVVNEFIATKLKLRSSTLKDALQRLIDDPTILNNFYAHGLIASNSRASATGSQTTMEAVANGPAGRTLASVRSLVSEPKPVGGTIKQEHPSYLAGGTVALALMGSLLKRDGAAGASGFADVKSAIDKLPDSKLKDALQANVLQANQDIDALRQGIATWFDDAMDRLSGAYKRKMKWIAMLIGLLVAVAFNADSFKVATTLWNDDGRRESAIVAAKKIAEKPLPADQSVDKKKLEEEFKNVEGTLHSLPVGWNCVTKTAGGSTDYWTCVKQEIPKLTLVQILGWLLTAAALSLGAPFWFDLLNKFINLRGTGEKPTREDKKTG